MSNQHATTSNRSKRARAGERTMLACIGCKQRKLKCDRRTPKCLTCERTDRECLVEDPATGLHRPRGYMQSLEARVAYLEGLLQHVRPEVAVDHLASPSVWGTGGTAGLDSPGARPPILNMQEPSVLPLHRGRATSADTDEQNVDQLSSEVALLCVSAAGREPLYFGSSSFVSFSRLVSATMGLPRHGGNRSQTSACGNGSEHNTEGRRTLTLWFPSASERASLTQAYFGNIHPQYPFLHRPTFQKLEASCVVQLENGTPDMEKVALFFVLMVYAIGALVLGQSYYDSAQTYYGEALKYISEVLDMDGLESIQAILCCAVYSVRSPIGVSLWKVSGMAIRHCIELGYHRSTDMCRTTADTLAKEMSKRCFWVAYDIDRVAAFILGRPVGIPDAAIDIELPLDIDDENITPSGLLAPARLSPADPPTLMTGAIHAIKLRRLWTKIGDILYPTSSARHCNPGQGSVESLRQELEDWRCSTPDQLDHSYTHPLSVFASSQWFQLAYDHAILLLYRHYIDGTALRHYNLDKDWDQIRERAFEECALRAREMCLLYQRVYQSPGVQFTWGSLHILFTGGITYLYCLWCSKKIRTMTRQSDVISTCMACTTVLVIIAERWNLATSYRDIFEALSERTINMIYNGEQPPEAVRSPPNTSTTAKMLPSTPGAPSSHTDLGTLALQDWIIGLESLDSLGIPQDSAWLVHELLQGVQDRTAIHTGDSAHQLSSAISRFEHQPSSDTANIISPTFVEAQTDDVETSAYGA